jgi:uncharacterized membrane protein
MDATPYNAWKWVSLSPLPGWALASLGVAVAVGVALAGWGVLREPVLARRAVLWTLRILAGLAALFFLLEPGFRHLQVARVKSRLALLVDRSASMSFPVEAGGPSRAKAVGAYLASISRDLAGMSDRFEVETYGFDPELAPVTAEELQAQSPRGGRTDLLAALRAVAGSEQSAASKKLSGVLLFSDGADNAELAGGVSGSAKSALEELGVPVSTMTVGREGLRDLAVEQVKVDDFAFVRNAITVEAEIRGRGFKGEEISVVLAREDQIVASKTVKMASSDDVQTVSFTFTPDQTGRFVYTVSVPIYPDEIVTENNARSFVLKVIRDRVRVLLVVGRPSWDERFLRGLLRQDPNVDLVSFYILRTSASQPLPVGGNEQRDLSLIPFPMQEIFETKLHTFDVVIFQNFGYTDPSLNIYQYEQNLERYIFGGGAMVMIGGDHAFGEGHATMPVLMQAMPVEPSHTPAAVDAFRARVTPQGTRHPVTALGPSPTATEAAWSALPEISGANLAHAKPGATVLLEHPFQTVDGKNAPLLALWDYGRGRTMALTTDASWYWAFPAHAGGAATRSYDRLWSNALRWLVRDPDLTTLKLSADPPAVEPGKPIAGVITARLPDYQPAAGAQVRVDLISVRTGKVVASQQATAGADGVARVEFPPPEPGPYKLVGTARAGDRELGSGEDAVAVRAVGPELADASVRSDWMADIAKATGGKAYRLPRTGLPELPLLEPPVVEVGRSKDEPLWDRWYYLVALAGLLGTEWFLRRRFGYV